jgi:hypothetical protein
LALGLIFSVIPSLFKKLNQDIILLVFGSFLAFFVAHSFFWYNGIFASMGLKRVFVGVMPQMSIIALIGLNYILSMISNKKIEFVFISLLTVYLIIFHWTKNPASIFSSKEFLSKGDVEIDDVAKYLKDNQLTHKTTYHDLPYLSFVAEQDYFEESQRQTLSVSTVINSMPDSSIIIWDNWYARDQFGLDLSVLTNNQHIKVLKEYRNENNEVNFCVMVYRAL